MNVKLNGQHPEPGESALHAHRDRIAAWREESQTWQAIAAHLKEECWVEVSLQTVQKFYTRNIAKPPVATPTRAEVVRVQTTPDLPALPEPFDARQWLEAQFTRLREAQAEQQEKNRAELAAFAARLETLEQAVAA